MAFIDLEKAFDRVPKEVLWWSLRTLGVEEWIIRVIQSMYDGAMTAVKLKGGESKEFEVKVGVHQGSVLSPLLFTIVLEALSRESKEGLPFELLYADDLALLAESENELMEKVTHWKVALEAKGLKVNMGKTKVMRCRDGAGTVEKACKDPCSVCRTGVGRNSILCTKCRLWVHKRCCGIKGRLKMAMEVDYQCPICVNGGKARTADKKELLLGQEKLECVDKFCYLGDMIGAGGGAEDAVRARTRCAWGKFNELGPILTARGASLRLKGKIYACVQCVMVYGSETWPMK